MARRKVSKSAKIISNNQQRLVVVMEGNGGVAQMEGDGDLLLLPLRMLHVVSERRRPHLRTRRSRHNNLRRHHTPSRRSCRRQRLNVTGFAVGVSV